MYLIINFVPAFTGLPQWLSHKEYACNTGATGDTDFWVGKIPWRRAWPPTPVFLPGDFHGHRSLAGHSPYCHKELDTTEMTEYALHASAFTVSASMMNVFFTGGKV